MFGGTKEAVHLRIWVATILFLGSYLPLSMILLAQNFQYEKLGMPTCWINEDGCSLPFRQPAISISFFLLCLVCFAMTWMLMHKISPRQRIKIAEAKHIPIDLMNYVLPYIVSFMGIDYADSGKMVGFIVFLIWMFVLIYRSDRIIMNPLFTVFGWKLYEVKHSSVGGEKILVSMVLSKVALEPDDVYRVDSIQDVLIIKGEDGQ